jgi:lipoprotein NlpI
MRMLGLLVAAGVVLAAGPAGAASEKAWDDCQQKTDLDRRIVGCTKVVADEDEDDDDRAVAYTNRGNAYVGRGDFARGIADYSEAAKLDPEYVMAFANRGRAYLFTGVLDKARSDFQEAYKLDPKSTYSALWLEVANRRSNVKSVLKDDMGQLDMKQWPAPVLRAYLGEATPAQVLAEAKGSPDQVCEANFYSGELALSQGNKDEATRLFKAAAGACSAGLIEFTSAKAELRALGIK